MTSKEALKSIESELRCLQGGKLTAKQGSKLKIILDDVKLMEKYKKYFSGFGGEWF